jgi:hypothetical protein
MAADASPARSPSWRTLIVGDVLVLSAIAVLGFATHRELQAVGSARFLATLLPLVGAWLVTAGGLGALDPARAIDPRQLWRPAVAVLVATPIAAVLRSAWLGTPPVLIFLFVIGAVSLLGIGAWRLAFCLRPRPTPP